MVWTIDTTHSHINFAVRHMMVSQARGGFKVFNGEVVLDDQHLEKSKITAHAETASIDTGNEQRDAHLRSADFFDAEKFPTISFVSTKIEQTENEEFKVTGDLTIHGVTKSVTFTGEFSGKVKDVYGVIRAGINAHTTINRKDFGLSWNAALEAGGWAVDEKVKIEIDLEITEKVPSHA